jgi:hypothetical protein
VWDFGFEANDIMAKMSMTNKLEIQLNATDTLAWDDGSYILYTFPEHFREAFDRSTILV